ncbi:hypothetical protein JCM19233_6849 [Vibrio astriarenae]|nr:hypothetical protein JCM19233_6849 [Vibrio sp. C7]
MSMMDDYQISTSSEQQLISALYLETDNLSAKFALSLTFWLRSLKALEIKGGAIGMRFSDRNLLSLLLK